MLPPPVSSYAYASDAVGRRTAHTDTSDGLQSGNAFGYNARSELVEATMDSNAYAYAYDPIGNREWAALNAETNLYAADALHLYGEIRPTAGGNPPMAALTPSYDADGNMLSDGNGRFYAWNAENRMILASNAAHAVTYAYDHQGRMILKEVFDTSDNYKLKTINFLWDGWNIFREVQDTAALSVTNYYTWGPDLSGMMQGAGGVGGLVAVTTVSSENPQYVTHFPCYDANGNITEYVATNGTVAARYAYDAFGSITAQSGPMADTFTHRFSTKPFDAETGLVMFQLRPYDPPTGRFIGRDPIEERGGRSLHRFVGNDAINAIDYLGLKVKHDKEFNDDGEEEVGQLLPGWGYPATGETLLNGARFFTDPNVSARCVCERKENKYYVKLTWKIRVKSRIVQEGTLHPNGKIRRTKDGVALTKKHEANHRANLEALYYEIETSYSLGTSWESQGACGQNADAITKNKVTITKRINDERNHTGEKWEKWFKENGDKSIW